MQRLASGAGSTISRWYADLSKGNAADGALTVVKNIWRINFISESMMGRRARCMRRCAGLCVRVSC
jgi:hypothetical protein